MPGDLTSTIVSTKIYDKWDDFNFEIVDFPFLYGDVPRCNSYGVYISQLTILQECVLMLMTSTTQNLFCLTAKLLKQDYRYIIRKVFSKFLPRTLIVNC